MLCGWTLPALLLSALAAPVGGRAAPLTYDSTDPSTGARVTCDACPPGTFLRARCTSARGSDCAPCPAGSYTEVWNYIGRCLRCGVCGHNQAVKDECTAVSDCRCQCKRGYYHSREHDTCVPHGACPPGRGVLSEGTAEKDTVCYVCPSGTYSNVSSARHNCTAHRSCSDAGLQEMLRGSTWHDSVCANCEELEDGAYYLKEIIPGFFARHKVGLKRLRRIVHMLPSEDGKKQSGTSQLTLSEFHARIRAWVSTATAMQIRQLHTILAKTRVASERLQHKLNSIDKALMQKCT